MQGKTCKFWLDILLALKSLANCLERVPVAPSSGMRFMKRLRWTALPVLLAIAPVSYAQSIGYEETLRAAVADQPLTTTANFASAVAQWAAAAAAAAGTVAPAGRRRRLSDGGLGARMRRQRHGAARRRTEHSPPIVSGTERRGGAGGAAEPRRLSAAALVGLQVEASVSEHADVSIAAAADGVRSAAELRTQPMSPSRAPDTGRRRARSEARIEV